MITQGRQMLESAQALILKTATELKLGQDDTVRLLNPDNIHIVEIPVVMDDGTTRNFTGYRIQHNNLLGPYKGGIRFHPQVSQDEVQALATLMSIKTSAAGIPLGGGKGGVIVDPKSLSQSELERLSRGYVTKLVDVIGEKRDIPAPDVNTNPTIINWMADEYVKIQTDRRTASGASAPDESQISAWRSTFTGKPVEAGGSLGRTEATGRGGVIALMALFAKLGRSNSGTVAIQGFGNVGYYFAKLASERGFSVVAVSDSKSGIMDNDQSPLDIEVVMECKKKQGTLAGCYCVGGVCDINRGRVLTNEELLTLPVDVLVPSALENVINESNMRDIRAKVIVEMANGPITEEAFEYLNSRGVVIIPDVYANSGGVIVSYLEWLQGLKNEKWSEQTVNNRLHEIMTESFEAIWIQSVTRSRSLKEAAFEVAIERIINKMG